MYNIIQFSSVKDNFICRKITGDHQCGHVNFLLIRHSAFVTYLRNDGNIVGQCISYSQTFKTVCASVMSEVL
jgi:hypothetical protein